MCPTHRHPKDHACSKASTPIPSRSSTPTVVQPIKPFAKLNLAPSQASSAAGPSSSGSNPTSARAAAAAAALKRAGQQVKQASDNVQIGKTKEEKYVGCPSPQKTVANDIRRSLAEQESAFKALKARKDKGVLSKAEEVSTTPSHAHQR